jgi:hypothetical protein
LTIIRRVGGNTFSCWDKLKSFISLVILVLVGISWSVVTGSLFLLKEVLSGLVSVLKVAGETLVSGGSGVLGSSSSLGSLGLKEGSSGGVSGGLSLLDKGGGLLGEWVDFVHHSLVGEWVLLGLVVDSDGSSLSSELGLNLVGVDDSGKISAGHHVSVEGISGLLNGVSGVGSEKFVKMSEGSLGEDNESSEVTTWGELDDVKSTDVADIDSWQISGGSSNLNTLIVIDDEWSLLQDVLGVSIFTLSVSERFMVSHFVEVVTNSEVVESGDERLGVWNVEAVENEWELWDVLDLMTSGHHERSNCGGGKSSCDSVASLGEIDSSVPLSPDLEWSEHSGLSAHVTESGLSGSRSTGSTNSWDSCDGSSGTPGLSGVLLSCLVEDSMTLSSVLGQFRVNEVDEIVSDWCVENSWHWHGAGEFLRVVTLVDGYNRS